MSGMESMIWMALGYAALPVTLLSGFIGTALIACFLLDQFGKS